MLEKIKTMTVSGKSNQEIAEALNKEGLKTPRGKKWEEHSVAYQLRKDSTAPKAKKSASAASGPRQPKKGTATAAAKAARLPKVAARKVDAPTTQAAWTLGRQIDLALEVLGAKGLDPAKRIAVARQILGA